MLSSKFWLALRDLQGDLSSFHLLKYGGRVDGFLFTAKNSGTHWLRAMLSAAIAHHLGLDPPVHTNGPGSDAFIHHPKRQHSHPQAPRIGCSHTIPSRLTLLPLRLGIGQLAPTVVLARHIPEALSSYHVKWAQAYGLGELSAFVRRPPPGRKRVDDVWWYIRFFNRWGRIAEMAPEQVLVVRYEQLHSDPGALIARIWAHWGVALTAEDVAAGVRAGSRALMTERLDPASTEVVMPDPAIRANGRLSPEDRALLWRILAAHLRYTLWPTVGQASPRWPPTALRPRPAEAAPVTP
jgi:hypothetical protein